MMVKGVEIGREVAWDLAYSFCWLRFCVLNRQEK